MSTAPTGIGLRTSVRVFTQLKQQLLVRTLSRAGAFGVVAFLFSCGAALAVTIVVTAVLLNTQPGGGTAADVGVVVAAGVALFSTVAPIAGAGIDDTISPAKLALLPLRTSTVLTGSASAALVGPWPAAGVIITTLAITRAGDGTVAGSIAAVVAIPIAVLIGVSGARAVTTGLSLLLRKRRVSEFAAFTTIALLVAAYTVPRVFGDWVTEHMARLADVVSWTPFGFAPGAAAAAGRGDYGGAVLRVVLAGVTLATFAWAWNAAVQRALTTAESAGRSQRARTDRQWHRAPAVLAIFPERPWAAVATRVLREYARNSRRRVALIMECIPGVVLSLALATNTPGPVTTITMMSLPAAFMASGVQNLFGLDGASSWADIAAGLRPRTVIIGHCVAVTCVAVVVLPIITIAVAIVAGHAALIPVGLVASFGVFFAALGGFVVAAAYVPSPLPDEPTNAWTAQDAGRGCLAGIVNISTVFLGIFLGLPATWAAVLSYWSPALAVAAIPIGIAVSLGIWWAGIRLGGRRLATREPELLRAITFAGE